MRFSVPEILETDCPAILKRRGLSERLVRVSVITVCVTKMRAQCLVTSSALLKAAKKTV